MATALTALANVTLGASASTVTFSSISGSYRDLILVINAKNTVGATGLRMRVNGDTSSTYSWIVMEGNGSSSAAGSSFGSGLTDRFALGSNTTAQGQQVIQFLDYSTTDKHKPVLARYDDAGTASGAMTGRWASTSAITSLVAFPDTNQFAAGSTFALYGVSA